MCKEKAKIKVMKTFVRNNNKCLAAAQRSVANATIVLCCRPNRTEARTETSNPPR